MLNLVFLSLVVYAAFAAWPWWLAAAVGAASGLCQLVLRFFGARAERSDADAAPTFAFFLAQFAGAVLLGAAWSTAAFLALRWIITHVPRLAALAFL